MKGRQEREMRTLTRCKAFLDTHADIVGPIVDSGSKTELDAAVQEAASYASQQAFAKIQRTAQAAVLRTAKRKLRQSMQPVAEVAKSTFQEQPNMMGLFMPPTSIATARLVAAAAAMADGAGQVSGVLIGAGLKPTFADDIRTRATAVTNASILTKQAVGASVGASRGMSRAITRGRRAIAVIDALIVPTLEESPDLLANWKGAKRIPAKPGPTPM